LKRVTVEYEFLNESNQDITTEVAFPTPPYDYGYGNSWYGVWSLSDFRVWVDGREIQYKTDARAKLNGNDFTDQLHQLGVDIQTFAHVDTATLPVPSDKWKDSQIPKLSKVTKEKLLSLGLISAQEEIPTWTVYRTYHWRQRFPAGKVLNVKHEYTPVFGFQPVDPNRIRGELKEACLNEGLEKRLRAYRAKKLEAASMYSNNYVPVSAEWVKYILTTANTWKTPIKDFELIIEETARERDREYIGTSVCWDGKVERLDKNHLVARKANFVPTRELIVYFFNDY